MDPRTLTGSFSPVPRNYSTDSSSSGGAASQVGQPGKTMYQRPVDELTRPMTRQDFINFISDPEQMDESERHLFYTVSRVNFFSTFGGFAAGFYLAKFFPWKKLEVLKPPKHYVMIGRTFIGFGFLSVSFLLSQRWALQQIMKLDEGSPLLFNTKRFLMSQRGNMMFARSEIKEITKADMEKFGGVGNNDAQDLMMKQPAPDGSINTEYSLSHEQFLPIAQTGYKPPPD